MSRGHNRERQVKGWLEKDGWFVVRTAGSLGLVDLVAVRDGDIWLIEVKSDRIEYGPFNNFPPARRRALIDAAEQAGGEAWLAYWPPHGSLTWLSVNDWPGVEEAAA